MVRFVGQKIRVPQDDFWGGTHGELMRASVAFFAHEVLRGPEEAPYNGKFLIGAVHEEWDNLVLTHDRICVMAPRDHGKSFFFDFAVPLHKAIYGPRNGRGFIFSATKDQAIRILGDIKAEIEDNPKLQWLIPAKKTLWSMTSVKLGNGFRIYARGFGSKVRGAHPDWIIVDDGLNDEDGTSETVRAKHVDYFFSAITNMVTPGGQIIVVGTPFHGRDLYAQLAKNTRYVFRKYPALSASGKPLFPERYSLKRLMEKREEVGSLLFTREFLCQPVSDDMSLFPDRLFRGEPTEQYRVSLGAPAKYWDSIGVTRRYAGVDLALSSTTRGDWFVIFVVGVDALGNRWVIDIIRMRGLAYQQMLSLINAACRKYDVDLCFIEANQAQSVFGDELIRTTDLPIKKFVTSGTGSNSSKRAPRSNMASANKNLLAGGVPALRVLLENKKFRIPRGDPRSVEVTEQWIEEMRAFTYLAESGKLSGVGEHDDTVMALWIAEQAVKSGGFSFSTGSEQAVSLEELVREQTGMPYTKPAANGARKKLKPKKRVEDLDTLRTTLEAAERSRDLDGGPSLPDIPVASGNLGFSDDTGASDEADDNMGLSGVVRAAWSVVPGRR